MFRNIVRIGGVLILLTTISLGCVNMFKLADLRTETTLSQSNSAKGRTLLKHMQKAHGVENWNDIETYSITLSDRFLGFVGKQSHPFAQDSTAFRASYIPGTFDGRLTQISGKDSSLTWGIQSWQTYTQSANEPAVWKGDKNITFWVPTYQYFIEFPLRISEATVIDYAGERQVDGIACEGIMASWDTLAPQKEVDQYLIWLDKETHRIVKMEYTVREQFGFLTGAASFKDYRNYGGLLLPTYLPVGSNMVKKGLLHEMRIHDWRPNDPSIEVIRPQPQLAPTGAAKG